MNDIVVRGDGGSIGLLADLEHSGALTLVGLRLPATIGQEQFEALLVLLGQVHEALQFAIGDAILFGEAVWGEECYQLVEALGISEASRGQYVRVAERIPISRRVPGLTWTHHRIVCHKEPDDQDYWLGQALQYGWSANELLDQLRAGRVSTDRDGNDGRTQVVERVLDAAGRVWSSAEEIDGVWWRVRADALLELADALGVGSE